MNGYGSSRVGIVVSIGTWRATVHYVDCALYRQSLHRRLPLPRTIRVRLCRMCRPTEDDVRAAPPEVSWYAWSHTPGPATTVVHMDAEAVDNITARRSMGHGRTPARRTQP